jgi:mediator of RNA polymerase II transcription subunit 16, fungi type
MGPHNPSTNKSALVAVTRGGIIRLLFQSQEMRWQDTKTEIDSISTSAELLTHAAMCADRGRGMPMRNCRILRMSR